MPDTPDITIHRFSNEVFDAARDFAAAKQAADAAQQRMDVLREQFPAMAALADGAPADLRDDLKNALSEASMDLGYVDTDGMGPTSRRLGRLLREGA